MNSQLTPLEQLRKEIDRIDDAMHDLLMQRALAVQQIAKGKPPGKPVWRPAREAAIMRRLLARHGGPLAAEAVVRLWREIIGIFAAQQAGLVIAANIQDHVSARNYFGDFALLRDGDPLASLAKREADIAVLPWPSGNSSWWHELPDDVFVSAGLPFIGSPTHVALSMVTPEATAEDLTWLAIKAPHEFEGHVIAAHGDWTLMQVPGFMLPDDPAFQSADVRYVGSFAAPFTARTT